jgi:hypothetical protein
MVKYRKRLKMAAAGLTTQNEAAGVVVQVSNSIYQLSGVHLTGAFGPSHCMYAPPGAFTLMM